MRWDSGNVSTPETAMILSAEARLLARPVDVLIGRPSRGITLPDIAVCLDRSACSQIILTKGSVDEIIVRKEACGGDARSGLAMSCSRDGLFL